MIPWSKLLCSVQTGQPSFDNHFGVPFFDHLTGDPEEASTFSDLLIDLNRADAPAVAADYGLSPAHVADIGGATGHTLTPLLEKAGFKLNRVIPTNSPVNIVEAMPKLNRLIAASVESANHCVWIRVSGGDAEITLMAGKPGKGPLRFVDSHPSRDETASRVGPPDVCVGGKGGWCEGPHAFNRER